jgi:hypothetical protein
MVHWMEQHSLYDYNMDGWMVFHSYDLLLNVTQGLGIMKSLVKKYKAGANLVSEALCVHF